MSARRTVVAFVQVVDAMGRLWWATTTGASPEAMLEVARHPPILGDPDDPGMRHRARWWCAADAPVDAQGPDFQLRRVYRTEKVPEHAQFEVCGIPIRELQAMMGRLPHP